MRRRLAPLLLALLFLFPFASQAQDQPTLTPPDALTFIRAVVENSFSLDLYHLIAEEFALRYSELDMAGLPFDDMVAFNRGMGIGPEPTLPIDAQTWLLAFLESGLREAQITDLSQKVSLEYFSIRPLHVNFTLQHEHEYLLLVEDFMGSIFYVLWADSQLYAVPIPIMNPVRPWWPDGGADFSVPRVVDLDSDGDDEVVITSAGYSWWSWCEGVYVLDWQDNQVVSRSGSFLSTCAWANGGQPVVPFSIDLTSPQNMQMVVPDYDGWACETVQIDRLDMLADHLKRSYVQANTIWCQLSEAAEAVEQGHYEAAAALYKDAATNVDGEMQVYLQARAALAVMLAGNMDQALTILNNTPTSGQMGEMIVGLSNAYPDPAAMCQVAFDFFDARNPHGLDGLEDQALDYPWTPPHFYFGSSYFPRDFPYPSPARAGCDPTVFGNYLKVDQPKYYDSRYRAAWNAIFGFGGLAYETKWSQALDQIDYLLEQTDRHPELDVLELQYRRALVLEQLGREDEAAAAYAAIYEAAPASSLGMLAALHFE
jgi:hypothetical protein